MPEKKDLGKLLLDWEFPEFEQHKKTRQWYILASIFGGALMIWALVTANYLLALIIIMVAIIIAITSVRKPMSINFEIYEDGLVIGERLYNYKDIDKFWLVYKPPLVKKLYLLFKSALRPEISIPLGDINPLRVRKVLLEYIEEDLTREDESTSDQLQRLLKL